MARALESWDGDRERTVVATQGGTGASRPASIRDSAATAGLALSAGALAAIADAAR